MQNSSNFLVKLKLQISRVQLQIEDNFASPAPMYVCMKLQLHNHESK